MTDTTFDRINKLANERTFLYRLTSERHLTESQLNRIHEIEGQLISLWDVHRRELVASHGKEQYNDAIRRVA